MPGELKLVTASSDQTARLWDVSSESIKEIDTFNAHTRSVKTVAFRPEDKAVFATGGRDGNIMLWDIRATRNGPRKPDNCIANGHIFGADKKRRTTNNKKRRGEASSRTESITGLTFQDEINLISGAAGDGIIKVWDIRKNYSVHKKDPIPKYTMNYYGDKISNGFTSLLVCPSRITLYASCMDNIIYAYNISSYNKKPFAEFYGHENSTFYVKTCLSPDGQYLASGSSDSQAYIWKTNKPGSPLVQLAGHTKEVTCVAWCSVGETKIVTCSDDRRHRIWKVGLEHEGDNEEIEIVGQAEKVMRIPPPRQSALERTPTISRRRVRDDHTPASDRTPSDYNSDHDSVMDVDMDSEKRKRNRDQMLEGGSWTEGKYKLILSPIEENWEPPAKRFNTENRSARRLFSPSTSREQNNPMSPDASSSVRQIPFSPTLNLPNYVEDGTAPHLVQMSPQKSKENIDWLTKIRKERFELRKSTEAERNVTSQISTLARRNSRSKSAEPRKTKKPVSLFKFFQLPNRDSNKELFSQSIGASSDT